jgi:hypothetical protein
MNEAGKLSSEKFTLFLGAFGGQGDARDGGNAWGRPTCRDRGKQRMVYFEDSAGAEGLAVSTTMSQTPATSIIEDDLSPLRSEWGWRRNDLKLFLPSRHCHYLLEPLALFRFADGSEAL